MPLMRATADWYNADHEGQVERGQEFEASEYRATELEMAGLAVRALSEKNRRAWSPMNRKMMTKTRQ